LQKPELKQFGDLMPLDFDHHPVWIACHSADYEQPWYEDTDEATFRPWTDGFPVSPRDGMVLVRATFQTADGSQHPGFITPAFEEGDLGTMQPSIFAGSRRFSFWGGMFGIGPAERQALSAALSKGPELIFPTRFSVDAHLANGVVVGQVDGFYRSDNDSVVVEH
jgi:hypothetical protein